MKVLRIIGFILAFIGVAGILAAKGNSDRRSDMPEAIGFLVVGGIIIFATSTKEKDPNNPSNDDLNKGNDNI